MTSQSLSSVCRPKVVNGFGNSAVAGGQPEALSKKDTHKQKDRA